MQRMAADKAMDFPATYRELMFHACMCTYDRQCSSCIVRDAKYAKNSFDFFELGEAIAAGRVQQEPAGTCHADYTDARPGEKPWIRRIALQTHRPPVRPSAPVSKPCGNCGSLCYVVESTDGELVTIDVSTLETRLSETAVERRCYRHLLAREVGGHSILGPELMFDNAEPTPRWRWFSRRVSLAMAHLSNTAIHSEHFVTCVAVKLSALLPKLTNAAVTGDAAGNPKGKATGAGNRERMRQLQRTG